MEPRIIFGLLLGLLSGSIHCAGKEILHINITHVVVVLWFMAMAIGKPKHNLRQY
jgi:hypothetical protein